MVQSYLLAKKVNSIPVLCGISGIGKQSVTRTEMITIYRTRQRGVLPYGNKLREAKQSGPE